jgi:methionyl-tRNA formyltransferase
LNGLNITVLCNHDLASNVALNALVPALARQHRLRVFYSSRVGGGPAPGSPAPGSPAPGGPAPGSPAPIHALELLRFFEQSLFNELLFPALSYAARGERLGFAALGERWQVPVEPLNGVNSDAARCTLSDGAPDLFVSIRYGGILREPVIALPRLGVINLHSGLLPQYRGVMATFRAMLAGDEEIGTTLHTITDAGIDTGGIIGTRRRPVDYQRSYLWNVLQLYPPGIEMLLAAIGSLAANEPLAAIPQPPGGDYYSFPDADDIDEFHRRGLKLYDVGEIIEFAQAYLSTES